MIDYNMESEEESDNANETISLGNSPDSPGPTPLIWLKKPEEIYPLDHTLIQKNIYEKTRRNEKKYISKEVGVSRRIRTKLKRKKVELDIWNCSECTYKTTNEALLRQHEIIHDLTLPDSNIWAHDRTSFENDPNGHSDITPISRKGPVKNDCKNPVKRNKRRGKNKKKIRRLYKCDICHKGFNQRRQLITHTQTHIKCENNLNEPRTTWLNVPDTRYFFCEPCDLFFSSTENINVHKSKTCKRTQCPVENGERLEQFSHRTVKVDGADPNPCSPKKKCKTSPKGKKIFSKCKKPTTHKEKVTVYECTTCSCVTENRDIFRRHLKEHQLKKLHINELDVDLTKGSFFQCIKCGFKTKFVHFLKLHLRKHGIEGDSESESEDNWFFEKFAPKKLLHCGKCSFMTMYKKYLNTHMTTHEKPENSEKIELGSLDNQPVLAKDWATESKENIQLLEGCTLPSVSPENLDDLKQTKCGSFDSQNLLAKEDGSKHKENIRKLKRSSPDNLEPYAGEPSNVEQQHDPRSPPNVFKREYYHFATNHRKLCDPFKGVELTDIGISDKRNALIIETAQQQCKNGDDTEVNQSSSGFQWGKKCSALENLDHLANSSAENQDLIKQEPSEPEESKTCKDPTVSSEKIEFRTGEPSNLESNEHTSDLRTLKCEYCDFVTGYKEDLDLHMLEHKELIEFENSIVRKVLSEMERYDEKNFVCNNWDFETNFAKSMESPREEHKTEPKIVTDEAMCFSRSGRGVCGDLLENTVKNVENGISLAEHVSLNEEKYSPGSEIQLYSEVYKDRPSLDNVKICNSTTNLTEDLDLQMTLEFETTDKMCKVTDPEAKNICDNNERKNVICEKYNFATSFVEYLELYKEEHKKKPAKKVADEAMRSSTSVQEVCRESVENTTNGTVKNVENGIILTEHVSVYDEKHSPGFKSQLSPEAYKDLASLDSVKNFNSTTNLAPDLDEQMLVESETTDKMWKVTDPQAKSICDNNERKNFICEKCILAISFVEYVDLHKEKPKNKPKVVSNEPTCASESVQEFCGESLENTTNDTVKNVENGIFLTEHVSVYDEKHSPGSKSQLSPEAYKDRASLDSVKNFNFTTNLAPDLDEQMLVESETTDKMWKVTDPQAKTICDNNERKNFICVKCILAISFVEYVDLHKEKPKNKPKVASNEPTCASESVQEFCGESLENTTNGSVKHVEDRISLIQHVSLNKEKRKRLEAKSICDNHSRKKFICSKCNFATNFVEYMEFHKEKHTNEPEIVTNEQTCVSASVQEVSGESLENTTNGSVTNVEDGISLIEHVSLYEEKHSPGSNSQLNPETYEDQATLDNVENYKSTTNLAPELDVQMTLESKTTDNTCRVTDPEAKSISDNHARKKFICSKCNFATNFVEYMEFHKEKHTNEPEIVTNEQTCVSASVQEVSGESLENTTNGSVKNVEDGISLIEHVSLYEEKHRPGSNSQLNPETYEDQATLDNVENYKSTTNLAPELDVQMTLESKTTDNTCRVDPEDKSICDNYERKKIICVKSNFATNFVEYMELHKEKHTDEPEIVTNEQTCVSASVQEVSGKSLENTTDGSVKNVEDGISLIQHVSLYEEKHSTVSKNQLNPDTYDARATLDNVYNYNSTTNLAENLDEQMTPQTEATIKVCNGTDSEEAKSICEDYSEDSEEGSECHEDFSVDQRKNFVCHNCDFATNFVEYIELHREKHKNSPEIITDEPFGTSASIEGVGGMPLENTKNDNVKNVDDTISFIEHVPFYEEKDSAGSESQLYTETCKDPATLTNVKNSNSTTNLVENLDVQMTLESETDIVSKATESAVQIIGNNQSKNSTNADKSSKCQANLAVDREKNFNCYNCNFGTNFKKFLECHMVKHRKSPDNEPICTSRKGGRGLSSKNPRGTDASIFKNVRRSTTTLDKNLDVQMTFEAEAKETICKVTRQVDKIINNNFGTKFKKHLDLHEKKHLGEKGSFCNLHHIKNSSKALVPRKKDGDKGDDALLKDTYLGKNRNFEKHKHTAVEDVSNASDKYELKTSDMFDSELDKLQERQILIVKEYCLKLQENNFDIEKIKTSVTKSTTNLAKDLDEQMTPQTEATIKVCNGTDSEEAKSICEDYSEDSEGGSECHEDFAVDQRENFVCHNCDFATNFVEYIELHREKHKNSPEIITDEPFGTSASIEGVGGMPLENTKNDNVKNVDVTISFIEHVPFYEKKDSAGSKSQLYTETCKDPATLTNVKNSNSTTNLVENLDVQMTLESETDIVSKATESAVQIIGINQSKNSTNADKSSKCQANLAVDREKNFNCYNCNFGTNFKKFLECHMVKHRKSPDNEPICTSTKGGRGLSSKNLRGTDASIYKNVRRSTTTLDKNLDVQMTLEAEAKEKICKVTRQVDKIIDKDNSKNISFALEANFMCKMCNFRTKFKKHLDLHERKHVGEKGNYCNLHHIKNSSKALVPRKKDGDKGDDALLKDTYLGKNRNFEKHKHTAVEDVSNASDKYELKTSDMFDSELDKLQERQILIVKEYCLKLQENNFDIEKIKTSVTKSTTNLAKDLDEQMTPQTEATIKVCNGTDSEEAKSICEDYSDDSEGGSKCQEDFGVDQRKNFFCHNCDFATNFVEYIELHREKHKNSPEIITDEPFGTSASIEGVGGMPLENTKNDNVKNVDDTISFIEHVPFYKEKDSTGSKSQLYTETCKDPATLTNVKNSNSTTNLVENLDVQMTLESETDIVSKATESAVQIIGINQSKNSTNADKSSKCQANLAVDREKNFNCYNCNFGTNFKKFLECHMVKHKKSPDNESICTSRKGGRGLSSKNVCRSTTTLDKNVDVQMTLEAEAKEKICKVTRQVDKIIDNNFGTKFKKHLDLHEKKHLGEKGNFCNLHHIKNSSKALVPRKKDGDKGDDALLKDTYLGKNRNFEKHKHTAVEDVSNASDKYELKTSDMFDSELDKLQERQFLIVKEYCLKLQENNFDIEKIKTSVTKSAKKGIKVKYQCRFCDFKTKFYEYLILHENKHRRKMMNVTDVASKVISSDVVRLERPYKCNKCDFSTHFARFFEVHLEQHTESLPQDTDVMSNDISNDKHRLELQENNLETGKIKTLITNSAKEGIQITYQCRYCDFKSKFYEYVILHERKHGRKVMNDKNGASRVISNDKLS